jgi:glutathione S-transferase
MKAGMGGGPADRTGGERMYRLHGFFTQNTMKTLYVLEELGVDFEYCYVDLGKGDHRTETFRKMTPVGRVPVLEHDGQFLFESGPICRYVASVEHSPLYPADKLERARVDQWMTYFTCHPGRWLTKLFFEKIVKPVAGMGEPDAAGCEEAARLASQQLQSVNDLAYVEQARSVDLSLAAFPRLENWLERLEGRDSVIRARALVKPYMEAVMAR